MRFSNVVLILHIFLHLIFGKYILMFLSPPDIRNIYPDIFSPHLLLVVLLIFLHWILVFIFIVLSMKVSFYVEFIT